MQKYTNRFEELNAELIFIYREESEGADGLKKIKDQVDTDYRLAVDLDKQSTKRYSPKRMTFNNYVIDKKGVVRAIVPGTLKDRATAEELITILEKIEANR